MPARELAETVGHSKASMTLDVYTPRDAAGRGAADPLTAVTRCPGVVPVWSRGLTRRKPQVAVLKPALAAEEAEHADERPTSRRRCPECVHVVRSPGSSTFIPKKPVMKRQRQQHDAEDRQDPQHVVLVVRDHRLVRVLERLDDLLVVVEEVPDPLGRVDDVVEVELELLRQEALDAAARAGAASGARA